MHESVGESTNVLNGADWWKCCSVEGESLTIRSWSNPGQGQLGRHRGVMRRKSCMTPSADIYSGSRSESEVRQLTISMWGYSSIGRAPDLHSGGCRIVLDYLHQTAE